MDDDHRPDPRIHNKGSARLKSYDYASFGYESGWFHQPSIERAFASLQALIDRPRYDSVVLVGHSQGGVLAKLFVLDQLLVEERGEKLKVDLVITLDSPHRGPQPWFYPVAVIGGVWKRIPLLRRFPLFRQVAELGIGSKNMRRLKKFWKADVIPQQPCPAEPGSQRAWGPHWPVSCHGGSSALQRVSLFVHFDNWTLRPR